MIRVVLLLAVLALPGLAQAQLFRAYLASYGNDANPCTVAAPCRLLPAALNAVADGGEIWILDSANFNSGTVNIAKSASILAIPGEVGSFVAVGGTAALQVTGAGEVALRNIVIANNVTSPGLEGIVVSSGARLVLDNVVMAVTSTAISSNGPVSIRNSLIRDASTGLVLSGNAASEVSGTKFVGISDRGVLLPGSTASTTTVTITDCVFTNLHTAVLTQAVVSGAITRAYVTRSTITASDFGVAAQAVGTGVSASVLAGSSMFTQLVNAPFYQSGTGSSAESQGNNLVRNTGAVFGTLTTVGQM